VFLIELLQFCLSGSQVIRLYMVGRRRMYTEYWHSIDISTAKGYNQGSNW